MNFIDTIKLKAKENIKTIVLPESDDLRILQACRKIEQEEIANIILIGNKNDIENNLKSNDIKLEKTKIIDPLTYDKTTFLIHEYYELRKHKGITLDEAMKTILNNPLYFGCMLVQLGMADGQVSGSISSTSDTLRPALQIIKTKENIKTASSFFLMDVPNCIYGEDGIFIYSDCGMIQNPTSEELVEIAAASNDTFNLLVGKEAKIAFLSHSTFGSSNCEDAKKVSDAVKMTKEKYPNIICDGELQFDAAIIPEVAKIKAPNSQVAGHANVLIFPDLDAGNIGYKITERLAKAKAYGPITQGLNKPVNDLSRGCNVDDIVGAVAITAIQANNN